MITAVGYLVEPADRVWCIQICITFTLMCIHPHMHTFILLTDWLCHSMCTYGYVVALLNCWLPLYYISVISLLCDREACGFSFL